MSIMGYFAAMREAFRNIVKKPDTIMFPAEHVPIPPGMRGAPVLVPENCTLCNRCIRVCPTWALSIEKIDKNSGYFTVDLGRCCYCQECEKACPFDAIHLQAEQWLTAGLSRDAIKKTDLVVKPKKEAKS